MVLLDVAVPNNFTFFFLSLTIFDALALPHMDFYSFLLLACMQLVGFTCKKPDL